MTPWPELVEKVREDHNGIFHVDLYFGQDGNYECRLSDRVMELARGESDESIQEAVERCLAQWRSMKTVPLAANFKGQSPKRRENCLSSHQ